MHKQLVLAIFPSETAADQAAAELKGWEKANKEIKQGAIGVLVKDNDGKIKAHKLGTHETFLRCWHVFLFVILLVPFLLTQNSPIFSESRRDHKVTK